MTEIHATYLRYQWIVPALFSIVGALLAHLLIKPFFRLLKQHFLYVRSHWKQKFFSSLKKPLLFFIWSLSLIYTIQVLAEHLLEKDWKFATTNMRYIAWVVSISWFLLKWHKEVQSMLLAHVNSQRPYEKAKLHIYGRIITLTIVLLAGGILLQIAGVNLQTILTLGGVGGLALGIAGRDIFANIFSGLMIYTTRPFILGDWVRSNERPIEGIVEEIGWYYTVIRGFNKQPIYVPNSAFSTIIVANPSRMTHWRIEETIGVRYKDFFVLKELVQEIQHMLDSHPLLDQSQDHNVFFDKFTLHSLNISLIAYATSVKEHQIGRIKEDVLIKTGQIIKNKGLEFAYHITSVDFADPLHVKIQT